MTMITPPERPQSQEEVFEWAVEDGKMIKITSKNSNGRKCLACGCNCPCRCADCKPVCCTTKHNQRKVCP